MKLGQILRALQKDGECLLWTGGKFRDGYGKTRHEGKTRRVHRLLYEMINGEIPAGLVVCHTCDRPLCCNPDHLFLGTPRDNHHDAMRKGRHTKGEKVNTAKLSEAQVLEIRRRWDDSPRKYGLLSRLGREFGVCHMNIKMLVSRQTWKHLP